MCKYLLVPFLCMVGSQPAGAAEYPVRPITILVPYSAGGVTDTLVRRLAQGMSRELGQSIVVQNRPGGNGTIAAQAAANSAPDGYTLTVAGTGIFRQPHIQPTNLNPLTDLSYVGMVAEVDMFVVVKDDAPWRTIGDMVAYAKSNPNKIFYGVPALMGPQHLVMEQVSSHEKLDWTVVPFRGDTESLVALFGGEIQASIVAGIPPSGQGFNTRMLVSLNEGRSLAAPDVPTLKEQGLPIAATAAIGIAAPAGTPQAVIQRLESAIRTTVNDPDMIENATRAGTSIRYMDARQYTAYAHEIYAQSKDLIALVKKNEK